MKSAFDRTYSNALGFEGQDLCVTFEVESWGSPMTREHPGDPFEFTVGLAYLEDGTAEAPEFCPLKDLEEWLMEQFNDDPPEFYYDDGYDERER